jgi:ADP-ribose pyrophosphatase YjhB (NUDIX family)
MPVPPMSPDANSASVALLRGDDVLLIQRARAPYRLLWTLPGGRREPGETAEQCAIREVKEELAISIGGLTPILVQTLSSAAGDWRLAVFATRDFTGSIATEDEIADHRWFRRGAYHGIRTTAGLATILEKAFAACPAS